MRTRPAPVVVIAALVALVGCGDQQERERPSLGTHPSCQEPATHAPTRPFHEITVEGGEVVVEPDTVVQLPKAGIFAWMSADYSWRVTYTGEQAPISPDSIMRVGGEDTTRVSARQTARSSALSGAESGQASTGSGVSVSGQPGELVWAGVRADAPCRAYKYNIKVWGGDLDDTLTLDPPDIVAPY